MSDKQPTADLPVSDRTDEQIVRTIAEWMGLKIHDEGWFKYQDGHYCLVVTHDDRRWQKAPFMPHANLEISAADRERVMLAMPPNLYWSVEESDGHAVAIIEADEHGITTKAYARSANLGRAFCEAVVMWIEARAERDKLSATQAEVVEVLTDAYNTYHAYCEEWGERRDQHMLAADRDQVKALLAKIKENKDE